MKGVVPPSLSLPAFLAVRASCRSNCNALCVMDTSFVRDSGREAWVCPYSSFSIAFFPSWNFLRGEIVVFPHQQAEVQAGYHAALLFQPHSAPALRHCSWEVPGEASPLFHNSLPPPSPHCQSVCPQLEQSRVMLGPPQPWPHCFPLPLMRLPAWQDIQGCPADPSPGTTLPVLRQGLISLAAATK